MISKVAFVTYSGEPRLTADDRLVLEYLRREGTAAEPVCWDAEEVDWGSFDRVVLRSCWEYHLRTAEFLDWIDRLERMNVPLLNSVRIVRKNIDKFYLRDLAARGVRVPPSVWIERGAAADVPAILRENDWPLAVVKPTVSMSAHRTFITTPAQAQADGRQVREVLRTSGLLVQEFIREVQTGGEWSFVFLGGRYSHAVLKRPKTGDFRVQQDLGGRVDRAARPSPALISQAEELLSLIDEPLLYARVDGVAVNGKLILMELELIDPVLFLDYDPEAPARFARAILAS